MNELTPTQKVAGIIKDYAGIFNCSPNTLLLELQTYATKLEAAQKENDELALKVAAKPTWGDVNKEISRTNHFIKKLAELKKDKERLDWLDKQRAYLGYNGHGNRQIRRYDVNGEHHVDNHGKDLRTAIDAAIAERKEQG